MAAEVRPPWLEWASSMMMANLRRDVVADFVQDERELLHSGDDDLLARFDKLCCKSARMLGDAPTVAPTCANCLIVFRICSSRMSPVGDDDDRVENRLCPVLHRPIS